MSQHISELIGVYDADSTLIGEISYWVGARLGTTHCALCELTHGMFTQKSEWKECSRDFSVPFQTFHKNDVPADVCDEANGAFPLVLARSPEGLQIILTNTDLKKFEGSTKRFAQWLTDFLATPSSDLIP